MKIKAIILSSIIALFSTAALSGGGHSHGHGHSHEPVTQQQAEKSASRMIAAMVRRGRIDMSWVDVPVQASEKKSFNGRPEWVVTFTNEAITDSEKRTLYIFLTLTGEFVAANYTGH